MRKRENQMGYQAMYSLSRRTVLGGVGSLTLGSFLSAPSAIASTGFNFSRGQGVAYQEVGETLLRDLYSQAGIDIDVTPLPNKRSVQSSTTGATDGETLRIFNLGERFPVLKRMPVPLINLDSVAFVRSDSDVSPTSPDELKNFSSVAVRGVIYTELLLDGHPNANFVDDVDTTIKIVSSGRADVALTSVLDGQAAIRRLDVGNVVQLPNIFKTLPLYHYVHESKADVLDVITPLAKELEANGGLARMAEAAKRKYLEELG
ncbi:MAG: hypothetical protein AAGF58_01285 [Pseudomonadota bacterium]